MSSDVTDQLVIFTVAGEQYALPIARVQEIIRYTPPRTVDSADPAQRGVISLRGSIIPVFDLAARLGLAPCDADGEQAEIVIVEAGDQTIGVVVDDVDEVKTVHADAIQPVPTAGDALRGIAQIDDRLVAILDPATVFHGVAGVTAAA
jgi:purine-binding chemotaxis protein CheW